MHLAIPNRLQAVRTSLASSILHKLRCRLVAENRSITIVNKRSINLPVEDSESRRTTLERVGKKKKSEFAIIYREDIALHPGGYYIQEWG